MVKVTEEELAKLRELRDQQDRHASMLGVATYEWQRRSQQLMEAIKRTEIEQDQTGNSILKAHELDYANENLTIDIETGEIMKLVVGSDGTVSYKPI